jgi:hypothetical protein
MAYYVHHSGALQHYETHILSQLNQTQQTQARAYIVRLRATSLGFPLTNTNTAWGPGSDWSVRSNLQPYIFGEDFGNLRYTGGGRRDKWKFENNDEAEDITWKGSRAVGAERVGEKNNNPIVITHESGAKDGKKSLQEEKLTEKMKKNIGKEEKMKAQPENMNTISLSLAGTRLQSDEPMVPRAMDSNASEELDPDDELVKSLLALVDSDDEDQEHQEPTPSVELDLKAMVSGNSPAHLDCSTIQSQESLNEADGDCYPQSQSTLQPARNPASASFATCWSPGPQISSNIGPQRYQPPFQRSVLPQNQAQRILNMPAYHCGVPRQYTAASGSTSQPGLTIPDSNRLRTGMPYFRTRVTSGPPPGLPSPAERLTSRPPPPVAIPLDPRIFGKRGVTSKLPDSTRK